MRRRRRGNLEARSWLEVWHGGRGRATVIGLEKVLRFGEYPELFRKPAAGAVPPPTPPPNRFCMTPVLRRLALALLPTLFAITTSAAAEITSLSTYSAVGGTQITITGTGFDAATPGNNKVSFGEVPTPVLNATATTLVVTVPVNAIAARVRVTVANLVAQSPQPFIPVQAKVEPVDGNALGLNLTLPGTRGVILADFDGDGRVDGADTNIGVYRNTGTPGTIDESSLALPVGVGPAVTSIKAADLDGDGLPEIVATIFTGGLQVYRNTSTPGALSFIPVDNGYSTLANDRISLVADIDRDGRIDIVQLDARVARAGEHVVVAGAAIRNVIACTASNKIIAIAGPDEIIASAALSQIIARAAVDQIVAFQAV